MNEVVVMDTLTSEEYGYVIPAGTRLPVVERIDRGVIVRLPNHLQVVLPEKLYGSTTIC